MTPDLLRKATGCTAANAARFAEPIERAFDTWRIDTPTRQAAFIAQCAHESQLFSRTVENMNYSAERAYLIFRKYFASLDEARGFARNPQALANRVYGGRMGNVHPNDGWLMRAQGLIGLTGRENITRYANATQRHEVVEQPWLLQQPKYAADSAGWFWYDNSLNALADRGAWELLTRRINGGLNGYSERLALTKRALLALGAVKAPAA